jgi:hypothetical protein
VSSGRARAGARGGAGARDSASCTGASCTGCGHAAAARSRGGGGCERGGVCADRAHDRARDHAGGGGGRHHRGGGAPPSPPNSPDPPLPPHAADRRAAGAHARGGGGDGGVDDAGTRRAQGADRDAAGRRSQDAGAVTVRGHTLLPALSSASRIIPHTSTAHTCSEKPPPPPLMVHELGCSGCITNDHAVCCCLPGAGQ